MTTISEIIRKAINDHLVNHVNVGDDKRCRIDILVEQAEKDILQNVDLYGVALNNDDESKG